MEKMGILLRINDNSMFWEPGTISRLSARDMATGLICQSLSHRSRAYTSNVLWARERAVVLCRAFVCGFQGQL